MLKKSLIFVFVGILVFIMGCSSGNETTVPKVQTSEQQQQQQQEQPSAEAEKEPNAPAPPPQEPVMPDGPVEITILAALNEEQFKEMYADRITKKYPNVTVKQVVTSKEVTLQDLLIATPPDLIDYGITNLLTLTDLQIPLNLDPYVEKYNIDMNRFNQQIIKDIRSYSNKGELLMLPTGYQPFVLYYNKDIFDLFGVEYPKAGSTWDELTETAKLLSRTHEGTAYRGLDAGTSPNRMQTQLSLPFVDPETKKSLIGSDPGWTKLFNTYKNIYTVLGNFPDGSKYGDGNSAFRTKRTLAMYPHLFSSFTLADVDKGLNLGVTTFPQFADMPGVSTGVFGQGLVVSSTSKNPDAAFIIANYFTSDEVQIELGKIGTVTPLVSEEVRSMLLDGNPLKERIDVDVIHQLEPADPYVRTKWDKIALDVLRFDIFRNTGDWDINTLMRTADELINQKIAESN